jgi:heat-inducible transcriptional repressor
MEQLSERMVLVLSVIVDNYIKYKQAVGSRILTKRYGLNFSPATMRNAMNDLEEMGYLTHTHTSGGKIPTQKGYKFYLDMIMKNFSPHMKKEFENIPVYGKFSSLDEKMGKILNVASSLSGLISLLTLPDFSKTKIKNLELIKVSEDKIMCVIVSDNNIIDTKMTTLNKDITKSELKEFSEFITARYKGYSLEEISEDLRDYIETHGQECESIIRRLVDETKNSKVLVSGVRNVFNYLEFTDNLEKLKKIMSLLEEKRKIYELLKNFMNSDRTILIGNELPIEELQEMGLVSSSYKYKDKSVGVVGIMGPMNMDYKEILNIVESAKKKIDDILNT